MTTCGHACAHKQAAERFLDRKPSQSGLQRPPLLQMIQSHASAAVRRTKSYLVYPMTTL